MDYKARFRPLELLTPQRLDPPRGLTLRPASLAVEARFVRPLSTRSPAGGNAVGIHRFRNRERRARRLFRGRCLSPSTREAREARVSKRSFAKLPIVAALVLGGLGLSACVTQDYVDRRIDEVNTHINAVDTKVASVDQKADQALSAAQAAQASATQANQRIDALTTRVDSIEQRIVNKSPRG